MFSLTTLPVHCCSIVFANVTSLTPYPTLVTLLAKRTYISEYYCGFAMLRDKDIEALWSPVLQQNVLAVIRQTNHMKLSTVLLLNLTLQWRWQLWRNNGILSVQVLVWNCSMCSGLRLRSFSDAVKFGRRGIISQQTVTGRWQGRELWQFVLTPGLGLE
jgi:hypothetical protein